MEKREIIPPDEYAIDTELADLFQSGDRQPIAHYSRIKYWRVCAMLRPDDPQVTNTISESAAFIYGVLKLNREKARKVFGILYRLALEWGLVDDDPVEILESTTLKLRAIDKKNIQRMSENETTVYLARAAELEQTIRAINEYVVSVKNGKTPMRAVSGYGQQETH